MDKEQFNQMISNMESLQQADSKDLQMLTEKYPYFQIPYFVLAKKMQIEKKPDFDKYLKMAATYTSDRTVLYQFIDKTLLSDPELLPKKNLKTEETISIEQNERLAIEMQSEIIPEEIVLELNIPIDPQHEDNLLVNSELVLAMESDDEQNPTIVFQNDPPIFEFNLYELQMLKAGKDEEIEDLVKEVTFNKKKKVQFERIDFSGMHDLCTWLKMVDSNSKVALTKPPAYAIPITLEIEFKDLFQENFNEHDAQMLAQESLLMHDHLITETFANILLQQGKIQKAREMFEKLRLKYPEKSVYFASKIDELNLKN